ncbi:uncharacterized protein [Zea mays]|nr:uncharacterized protein LOC100381935 isoform 2 [Zea mays]XP_023156919.1 uncharacterized protein LOC100381935 isoform X2 [Zea mays]ACR34707.1 unknown [Zea mays]|eukprot:NP_001343906.1 uncharacterized protein LOC100381935 isoform 2 [Zea mays]
MANDDDPVDGENPRSFTASMITRWQKHSTWFQRTAISSKWRPSSSTQTKLSSKLRTQACRGHSIILAYEPVLS